MLDDRSWRPLSRRGRSTARVFWNGVERGSQHRSLLVEINEQFLSSWMHFRMLDSIRFHRRIFMSGPFRRYGFRLLVAALALSAGWNFGARASQSPPISADDIDAAILKAFQWRSIGPLRGGRSV